MKMKRGTDHSWNIRRYTGNTAWYAHCKCGYEYCCSKEKRIYNDDNTYSFKSELGWLAQYCPNCGARKKWYNSGLPRCSVRW